MEQHKKPAFNFVIADDDPDDQYMLQKVIWDCNSHHKITSVYNGMQLLEYLLRKGTYKNCTEPPPDCIFLDINMPLLDGGDVLKKMRETPALSKLRVHVLTSTKCPAEKEKMLRLGANSFSTKEPDINVLKSMFKDVITEIRRLSATSS
jgi:two-component system, response regulator